MDGQTTAKERSSHLGINAQNLNATANTGLNDEGDIKLMIKQGVACWQTYAQHDARELWNLESCAGEYD